MQQDFLDNDKPDPNDLQSPNTAETARLSLAMESGALIGNRYVIDRELGRGGIGVVYLAHDKNLLEKKVVVKILLEESLKDKWIVTKFLQEKEALTRIDHAGIVGILDAGETEKGESFIVIQYIDGENLRSIIKPGEGADTERAAELMRQIGDALEAAHEQNVFHRDLKPENIMLTVGAGVAERVKLIDFGIAKVKNSIIAPSTVGKAAVGTVLYMSPEQLNAKKIDRTSDIYALGIIAYEMLTGQRPFRPQSVVQLAQMQMSPIKLKPSDLNPAVSQKADAVVLRALEYEPASRFQSARDFGNALYEALTGEDEAAGRQNGGQELAKDKMQTGHVLFADVVGYSKLPIDEQTKFLSELQKIVRSTADFKRAEAARRLVRLPTGDGMALVFFDEMESPVRCAIEISRELKQKPYLKLRMGINSGPVNLISDVNDKENVAGAGINMAQRVMDCGDDGHILLSGRVAEDLGSYSRWQPLLHDLGEAEVKHGVRVRVFNLYGDDFGNSQTPEKFIEKSLPVHRKKLFHIGWIAPLALLAVFGTVWWFVIRSKTENQNTSANQNFAPSVSNNVVSPVPERALNYWIEVQKHRDGKPDKEPFRLAGEITFQAKDHIWLDFNSPQSGFLYIVNEGPETSGGLPEYNILFPTPTIKDASSTLAANESLRMPGKSGFVIDDERGTEKIWLVWSDKRLEELETAAKSAQTNKGSVSEAAQIRLLQNLLTKEAAAKTEVVKDDERKLTTVKGKENLLLTMRTLEHY